MPRTHSGAQTKTNTAGLPRASILLDKTFKTLYLCLKAVFGYNTPQDTGLYELTEDIRP